MVISRRQTRGYLELGGGKYGDDRTFSKIDLCGRQRKSNILMEKKGMFTEYLAHARLCASMYYLS